MPLETEPLVFWSAIDGITRAFGKDKLQREAEALGRLGIRLDKPEVAYPLGIFLEVALHLAKQVAPELSEEERLRILGRRFVAGFVQTPMGVAAHAVARLVGPKRTLGRLGRTFKSTGNYATVEFIDVDERSADLKLGVLPELLAKMPKNSDVMLQYRQGILEGVLDAIGLVGTVVVRDRDTATLTTTFRLTWQPR